MNRRVLDNVTMNLVRSNDDKDKSIQKYLYSKYGEGTLVKDCKTKSLKKGKGIVPLKGYDFISVVRDTSTGFCREGNFSECYIYDSTGQEHKVTVECLRIFKAISFYAMLSKDDVLVYIMEAMNLVDGRLRSKDFKVGKIPNPLVKYFYNSIKELVEPYGLEL